eukprot:scaffold143187_cov53-Cyclotella_meneghiniana.AAC.1
MGKGVLTGFKGHNKIVIVAVSDVCCMVSMRQSADGALLLFLSVGIYVTSKDHPYPCLDLE